jgi:hypothetical protein
VRLVWFALLVGCSRAEEVRPDKTKRVPPEPSWSAVPAPLPPEPSPSPSPKLLPSFDRDAARAALTAVSYKHCKLPRRARVIVRFVPTGSVVVDKVGVEDPLPSTVELCVIAAFEKATVPAFAGADVTIAMLVSP